MKIALRHPLRAAALMSVVALITTTARAGDPLPSWNDGPAKKSIITFVEKLTKEGSPGFVSVAERIGPQTRQLNQPSPFEN